MPYVLAHSSNKIFTLQLTTIYKRQKLTVYAMIDKRYKQIMQ